MKALTSKDGFLISRLDKNDESQEKNNNTSLEHILVNNDGEAANKGKIKRYLRLEHILGISKTFKKINEQLGFHPKCKTAGLHDFIYTTLASDFIVKVEKVFLYNQIFILDAEKQIIFINFDQK